MSSIDPSTLFSNNLDNDERVLKRKLERQKQLQKQQWFLRLPNHILEIYRDFHPTSQEQVDFEVKSYVKDPTKTVNEVVNFGMRAIYNKFITPDPISQSDSLVAVVLEETRLANQEMGMKRQSQLAIEPDALTQPSPSLNIQEQLDIYTAIPLQDTSLTKWSSHLLKETIKAFNKFGRKKHDSIAKKIHMYALCANT